MALRWPASVTIHFAPKGMATEKKVERHSRRCTVCASPNRQSIEEAYLRWESPSKICKQFQIRCQSALFLHVGALHLAEERDKHIKRCLAGLIEKNLNRRLSGSALIAAIVAFSRIDAEGRDAERLEYSQGKNSFVGWTRAELELFVTQGTWPPRFAA